MVVAGLCRLWEKSTPVKNPLINIRVACMALTRPYETMDSNNVKRAICDATHITIFFWLREFGQQIKSKPRMAAQLHYYLHLFPFFIALVQYDNHRQKTWRTDGLGAAHFLFVVLVGCGRFDALNFLVCHEENEASLHGKISRRNKRQW